MTGSLAAGRGILPALVLLLLLGACAGPRGPAAPALPPGELDRFQGSLAAQELGTTGWIVVEELPVERQGAAPPETVVVEGQLLQGPEPERLRVSTWRPTPRGWVPIGRSDELPGNGVGLLEPVACGEELVLLVASVEWEPDLERHRLFTFDNLPLLQKRQGILRDVEPAADAGFFVEPGGFRFDPGGDGEVERWRCVAGRFEPVEPAPDADDGP